MGAGRRLRLALAVMVAATLLLPGTAAWPSTRWSPAPGTWS